MARRRWVGLVLALALGAVAWWAARGASGKRNATPERPSVLFIAIDTLRADRLGCYGNPRGLTPNLDALAARGTRFEQCFSAAPWTLPSFASMFSSLTPQEHGAGGSVLTSFLALAPEHETVAERFRAAGWVTAAIVNVEFLGRNFGLMQGFAEVDERFFQDNDHLRDARETTDAALAWLEKHAGEPFFLFVHYFDPHARYAPPPAWRARFADARDQKSDAFAFGTRDQVVLWRNGRIQPTRDDFERAEKLYDAEVAYTDDEVGRLLRGLAAAGLEATTTVVVTADHGEEFLDHGNWEHGHTLYDELLHVPWIVAQPGRVAVQSIDAPVSTIDLAPTLCRAAGVVPSPRFRGRDLSARLLGRASAPLEPAHLLALGNFWGPALESLREDEWKIVRTPVKDSVKRELFHWRDDPREAHDRCASDAAQCERLSLELDLLERAIATRARAAPVTLTPEERARLRGLGYPAGDDEK